MADLDPIYQEMLKRKSKQMRVDRTDKVYVLDIVFKYEIEFSRCNTQMKLLRWVNHLMEKTWMTTELASWFIEAVCAENGWDIHGL